MKFLVLRNEESVAEIAEKAFKGLSATAKKQAESALLKLNPELKKIKNVRKGFIVHIPPTPKNGKPNRRNSVDPIENITYELSEKLDLFEGTIRKKFSDIQSRQNNYSANLKAAGKELKTLPNGEAAAKSLSKHLTAAKKANENNLQSSMEALKALQEIAASFDR